MRSILIALSALLATTSQGQEIQVHLDSTATQVEWTLGDVLHTVHGSFKLKRGDLRFDAASGKASGELIVDATSGNSGSGARDSRMHKNVLESAKYPEIRFVPDRVDGAVRMQGDSQVKVHGLFTIHGATHEIWIPVKTHIEGQRMTAAMGFAVPYVQWGMKDPSNFLLKVKDTVEIEIHATAQLAGGVN